MLINQPSDSLVHYTSMNDDDNNNDINNNIDKNTNNIIVIITLKGYYDIYDIYK